MNNYNFESSLLDKLIGKCKFEFNKTNKKSEDDGESDIVYKPLASTISDADLSVAPLQTNYLVEAIAQMYNPNAIDRTLWGEKNNSEIRKEIDIKVQNVETIKHILNLFEEQMFGKIVEGEQSNILDDCDRDRTLYFNILTGRFKINSEERRRIGRFFNNQIGLNNSTVRKALEEYKKFFSAMMSVGNLITNRYVSKMNEKWKTSIRMGNFDSFTYPWEQKEGFDFKSDWDDVMKDVSIEEKYGRFYFEIKDVGTLEFQIGGEEGVVSNVTEFIPKFTNSI